MIGCARSCCSYGQGWEGVIYERFSSGSNLDGSLLVGAHLEESPYSKEVPRKYRNRQQLLTPIIAIVTKSTD